MVRRAGVSVRARLTADHGLALGGCAKHKWKSDGCSDNKTAALVAQLDRAPDFESGGRGFESLRARHFGTKLGTPNIADFALDAATSVRKSTLLAPVMRTSFASTSTRW